MNASDSKRIPSNSGERALMLPIQTRIRPLPLGSHSLKHLGLGHASQERRVRRILEQPARHDWASSNLDRSYYLDLMTKIVRTACAWQDTSGAIIDPVDGIEFAQTTPRYAAPGAILLAFGRTPDLRQSIYSAMDWACRQLVTGQAQSPDFWMRELAVAYMCLEPIADPDRLARWRADLNAVEPEVVYWRVKPDGEKLEELHNWTVYAAAGEFLRQRAGLTPNEADFVWGEGFFEKYMPAQLTHFTENGMYRDPNDPITYDITTRLQIATALSFGYDGPLAEDLNELLRRGGLMLLQFVSPDGYAPFGGRSNQLNFQEAILTALCEVEARRYKIADPCLAGAFKRQAHRSAASVRRWILEREPFQFIKHGFGPLAGYGVDSYAKYSCYGLLAASFFGLAALLADDEIAEMPCPAELGGYALELEGAFHKVFATSGGTHVEIDTRADLHYEATGLGRFHRVGVPMELALSLPFTHTPNYSMPERYLPEANLAIGPAWPEGDHWVRLAELSEGLDSQLIVRRESPQEVVLAIEYAHRPSEVAVAEEYALSDGRLEIRARVTRSGERVEAMRFLVPLLVTDGADEARLEQEAGRVTVVYRGAALTIAFDPRLRAWVEPRLLGNRNGLYRCLVLEAQAGRIEVSLRLAKPLR